MPQNVISVAKNVSMRHLKWYILTVAFPNLLNILKKVNESQITLKHSVDLSSSSSIMLELAKHVELSFRLPEQCNNEVTDSSSRGCSRLPPKRFIRIKDDMVKFGQLYSKVQYLGLGEIIHIVFHFHGLENPFLADLHGLGSSTRISSRHNTSNPSEVNHRIDFTLSNKSSSVSQPLRSEINFVSNDNLPNLTNRQSYSGKRNNDGVPITYAWENFLNRTEDGKKLKSSVEWYVE
jgi:hypothetical protein